MTHLIHTYKAELDLTEEQKHKINRDCGTCRFIYNLYIEKAEAEYRTAVTEADPHYYEKVEQIKKYNKGKPKNKKKKYPEAPKVKCTIMSGNTFYKWLNSTYLTKNKDKKWIKETSSKAIRKAIDEAYDAYMKFFKGEAGHPRFKSRKRSNHSVYFVKPNENQPVISARHYVIVPGYINLNKSSKEKTKDKKKKSGRFHLKEKGYIPEYIPGVQEISSGRISEKNGRYYISVTVRFHTGKRPVIALKEQGEGIDLGIKTLATLSDGTEIPNINKSDRMKRKNKKLRRLQRQQSRRYEAWKTRKEETDKINADIAFFDKDLPEEARHEPIEATRKNLDKAIDQVAREHESVASIRRDWNKKAAHYIVSRRPKYITMEDLNVKGMMKNHHIARAVADCGFHELKTMIQNLCFRDGIEFRLADRFYASSKLCSRCHHKNDDLKLSDRIWICPECGAVHLRDVNAAVNLRDTDQYTVVLPDYKKKEDVKNIYI